VNKFYRDKLWTAIEMLCYAIIRHGEFQSLLLEYEMTVVLILNYILYLIQMVGVDLKDRFWTV